MSVSPINKWKYFLETRKDGTIEELRDYINGVFVTNPYFERGLKYEEEVYAGKHGKVSELVKDMEKQQWHSRIIEFEDFNIRLAGQSDAIDRENLRLIDIKRVDWFKKTKYDYSFQHTLYLYLNPDIKDFYYVVVAGKNNKITGEHIIHKKRPSDEELEKEVMDTITGFIAFLKENDLWELYKEKQQYQYKY